MALSLPIPPRDANERALAAWKQERFTGLTGTSVSLSSSVDANSGILMVFKNGSLVDPSTVAVSGATLTLGGALIGTDVLVVFYKARGV